MTIAVYEQHKEDFPDFNEQLLLKIMKLTSYKIYYMKKNLQEYKQKESIILQEEIEALIEIYLENPTIGGLKASLLLLENNKGIIGNSYAQELKTQLKKIVEDTIFKRQIDAELAKNADEREPEKPEFEHFVPTAPHQQWAMDFTEGKAFGVKFTIAEVYEVYSQAYLGWEIGYTGTEITAKKALENALIFTKGVKPGEILMDNGKPFLGGKFTEFVKKENINIKWTPPGEPWFNGALESGNTNLKLMVYTAIAFEAALNTDISKVDYNKTDILNVVAKATEKAVDKINNIIPRPKHGTTPKNILNGTSNEKKEENKKNKKEWEDKRTITNKKGGTFIAKIKKGFNRIVKDISNEKLYAIGELLNYRLKFIKI
jgi:transposase InsO family protein